jgi:NADPH:quinone reductase-like Zn-dependent oxidoreductase
VDSIRKSYEIREFGIDQLAPVDKAVPDPGPGEVQIRFHAASVNYRDIMIASGTYNPRMKLPAVPFSDAAGEISAVGEGVTKWKVSDRVSPIFVQEWIEGEPDAQKSRSALGAGAQVRGVLAEFGVFPAESIVSIPERLTYEEAATLPCAALTSWHALAVSGRLKAGDTVLTLGSGGVSIFAIQFAKAFGARVIATTSSEAKAERLRRLGADEVINYRDREDWDAAVLELTAKRGVDHVVEVGGGGTLSRSINAVRVGGHIALIGALDREGEFSYVPIFMKIIRLQGIFVGSRKMFEDMNRAIEENQIRPVIDRTFEFDQVPEALKYMQAGKHFGKIVVKI